MAIYFQSEDADYKVHDKNRLKSWISETIKNENNLYKVGEINFVFCSDIFIREMGKKYLYHDYFTDVITFNYSEKNKISGDIYISVETVSDNAATYSKSVDNEMLRVMIHGVLHLLGYDDATDAERQKMSELEDLYLAKY